MRESAGRGAGAHAARFRALARGGFALIRRRREIVRRHEMSSPRNRKHIAWKNVEREKLNPLIDREMVVGGRIMLARVLMKKGAHVPLHHTTTSR